MDFKMDHIVINTVDINTSLHFYTEILELHGERIEEFHNEQVPFPSVRLTKDTIIDLFPKKLWEKTNPENICRPNLNHFCLSTSKRNWELLQEKLKENGVTIEDGPAKRWGAHGSGMSIYFRDPDENVIEVRYYENEEIDRPGMLSS
jgi:catechol 2,3-dioxygenase-like lactoylglutathione lyase family enzyme